MRFHQSGLKLLLTANLFLPTALILSIRGHVAFGEEPAADVNNATWALVCENFFDEAKPLIIYPSRREGRWVAALGSSRIPNSSKFGWNVARYPCDVSALTVDGEMFKGTIQVVLGPDPWVPADRKPRKATLDVQGKLGPPDPAFKESIRSLEGTYKATIGENTRKDGKTAVEGKLTGKIEPTKIGELDNITYGVCFQNIIPGGKETDNQRRLWVALGIRQGKVISAQVGPVNMRHAPFDLQFFEIPEEIELSKDGMKGKLSFPYTSFDGEPVRITVEFKAMRVQGLLSGEYTARCVTEDGKEETRACTLDGMVSQGAAESRLTKDDRPWFVPVPGWKPVQPGEHPRLFFRKDDVPELKRRAETPEGKVIMARLRELLGGGEAMPTSLNPAKKAYDENKFKAVPGSYSISHAAGFGFLYQLSGEKKYADLARQCVELGWKGQRNFDDRYSWVSPGGELRAGPSLGWYALAYDLCYDAWDPEFRVKFAQAIQNYDDAEGGEWAKPEGISMRKMALTPKLGPNSNHYGAVCGGSGMAILAIKGDPGTEEDLVRKYDESLQRAATRAMTSGFGDGGFFYEGHGAEGVMADTAFVSYLKTLAVAQGRDYVNGPRPNAAAINVRRIWEIAGPPATIPYRSAMGPSYGNERQYADRTGLSHGGIFSEGFGSLTAQQKSAMLWCYQRFVEPDRAKDTFDTVSLYPHRAILALVNWPFGVEAKNPGEVLPQYHRDTTHEYWVFRNRWQDANDIIVTALVNSAGDNKPRGVMVWGLGTRTELVSPGSKTPVSEFSVARDRSGIISTGKAALAVDFSKASGAEALVVIANVEGKGKTGEGKGSEGKAKLTSVKAGEMPFEILTLSSGAHPEVKVEGDALKIGGQTVRFDGKTITLGVFETAK